MYLTELIPGMFVHSTKGDVSPRQFEAFQKGDSNAFKHIFTLYHAALYHTVLLMVNDDEDAKDIVADTFLKLASKREGMSNIEHVKNFLFIVARNQSVDHLKMRKKKRKIEDEMGLLAEVEYVAPNESEVLYSMRLQKMALMVEQLPARRKKIFRLYYSKGNIRTIAGMLNLAEQTVRNQLGRAIGELKKAVR